MPPSRTRSHGMTLRKRAARLSILTHGCALREPAGYKPVRLQELMSPRKTGVPDKGTWKSGSSVRAKRAGPRTLHWADSASRPNSAENRRCAWVSPGSVATNLTTRLSYCKVLLRNRASSNGVHILGLLTKIPKFGWATVARCGAK